MTGEPVSETPGFRPLYQQVKDLFIRRIAQGLWKPGEMLPSEQKLAEELKVSQGTVRKALDEMVTQNLVTRRQGRGTYVAEHSPQQSLFRFFHVVGVDGVKQLPVTRLLARTTARATRQEEERLDLKPGARVIRMMRLRLLGGQPAIYERITIPADLFKGFDPPTDAEFTSELYVIYQQEFDVSIVRAEEHLTAVAADAADAAHLPVTVGTPLLQIDRLAYTLDGRPVEWRQSRVDTTHRFYRATVE